MVFVCLGCSPGFIVLVVVVVELVELVDSYYLLLFFFVLRSFACFRLSQFICFNSF
jgi:hypothetical protein